MRRGAKRGVAFTDPWRQPSYGELAAATRRLAGGLRSAGINRERRVGLLLLDTVDFPIAFWGAIRAGVVPVPINTLLTHEIVGYILSDCRADALLISAPLAAAATAGAAQPRPNFAASSSFSRTGRHPPRSPNRAS